MWCYRCPRGKCAADLPTQFFQCIYEEKARLSSIICYVCSMAYEDFCTLDVYDGSLAAAKTCLCSDSLLLGFLTEIRRRKAFSDLECTGIWDNCHRLLKLGEAQSFYFQ